MYVICVCVCVCECVGMWVLHGVCLHVCVHCRVELSLQQNEIMNLFVDDYKNLPDTNWITGNKSDSSLNVSVSLCPTPAAAVGALCGLSPFIGVPVIYRLAVL